MLISYDRQFLFIHIQKTAGTSITNSLTAYANQPETMWENRLLARLGINVNTVGPWHRRRFRGHCSAADVQRHLPKPVFDQLFKFTFVRNPWDLLVSLYNFIPTRPKHRYQKRVAAMSFPEFVDEWTTHIETLQAPRICDRHGKGLLDFVGYYETLSQDFATVCERIGVAPPLPWDNRSKHADYREYYSDDLRQMVADRLAEDIRFFGYEFSGISMERREQLQMPDRLAA
jgi:hypothetical protein